MEPQRDKRLYTTHEAARLLGVTPITIIRWVEAGKLNCFTTVGGHRRIQYHELVRFAKEYHMPWQGFDPHLTRREFVILAVDDEPQVLESLRAILSEEPDLRLIESSNGFSAGARLIEEKPDLILLDFKMPELDGFDFCRFMRKDLRFYDISVVAMTGLKSESDQKRMQEVGVNDYLFRPFTGDELLAKVRHFRDLKRNNGAEDPPHLPAA